MTIVVKPIKRNAQRLLDFVIRELLENDFPITLRKLSAELKYEDSFTLQKGLVTADFEGEGFYKSTGMVTLFAHDDKIYCRQRYNEVSELSSFDDFVHISFGWYQFSHDRFDGWAMPADNFAAHYERLGLKLDLTR